MRKLDTKVLDADDTTALMKSITPDRCQQELQSKGGADFAIEYVDGYRFRVAVFKQRGSIAVTEAVEYVMQACEALAPGGVFLVLQYSRKIERDLEKRFASVRRTFSPANLPPAFLYRCMAPVKGGPA